jgi:glycosyltransferase involved in cell wall biosynthesis
MINTFKKMVDDGLKNWKFVIGASVKMKDLVDFQKMQATAAGYPISFVINATNSDLWKWYSQAKIYWHASGFGEDLTKHPERAEHFGISTVEAMSAGAIPVVINAGGQKEIVTDGSNGYLWNTQDEFIEKTNILISNSKIEEEVRAKGVKSAKKFDIAKFSSEMYDIVQA